MKDFYGLLSERKMDGCTGGRVINSAWSGRCADTWWMVCGYTDMSGRSHFTEQKLSTGRSQAEINDNSSGRPGAVWTVGVLTSINCFPDKTIQISEQPKASEILTDSCCTIAGYTGDTLFPWVTSHNVIFALEKCNRTLKIRLTVH